MKTPPNAAPMKPSCERCDQVHEAGCTGHVEECTSCGLSEGCFVAEPCPACGERVGLRPCRKAPMRGLAVCKSHGGRSPAAKAAGLRRLEERRVESALGKLLADAGAEAKGRGAEEVLLEQLWRASAMARLLEVRVGERGEDGLLSENSRRERVEHPLAAMLAKWTVEAAKLAKLALDANIAEREVRLVEGQAQMLADAMRTFGASFLELVFQAVDVDQGARRRLEDAVPELMRSAMTRTRAIDAASTDERSA